MRYTLYDFILHAELNSTYCDTRKEIEDILTHCVGAGDFPTCIVMQATTDQDRRYLGNDWLCQHICKPESCIHCNPVYEHAVLDRCLVCNPKQDAWTWHVDDKCLHCKENDHV